MFLGKSLLSSVTALHQYAALFSEINSMSKMTLAPGSLIVVNKKVRTQEGRLAGTEVRTASGTADNTRRHVSDGVLVEGESLGDCKAPTRLEGTTNHVRGGCGRSGGQAERIGELHAADLDGDVNGVNRRVEVGQRRNGGNGHTVRALNEFVHVPTRGLAVVGGLNSGAVANEITTSEQPGLGRVRHGVEVDVQVAGVLDAEGLDGLDQLGVSDARAESGDDKVGLEANERVGVVEVVAAVVLLGLEELHRHDVTVARDNLLGRDVRQELASFFTSQIKFLRDGLQIDY